jgi:hypothetical protein
MRPIAEWLDAIDRGDQLELRADVDSYGLIAGRIAGNYVARSGDSDDSFWSIPVGRDARKALGDRLLKWRADRQVLARLTRNPCETADPFESRQYIIRSYGIGDSGHYSTDISVAPHGRYLLTVTMENNWDPLGSGPPDTKTSEIDGSDARDIVLGDFRRGGYPAIVKKA